MCGGWSFALIMATMPLLGISDYRKFAVCLPFESDDALSLGMLCIVVDIKTKSFVYLGYLISQIYFCEIFNII